MDAIGNVFIADQRGGRIVELPAGCNSSSCQVTVPISGLKYPLNVKVDAAGDLYIMDTGSNIVLEVPPGCATSDCQINLGLPVTPSPQTLAVDWAGDVFVPNAATSQVLELQRSQPPSLSFASTSVGQTSSDSPQSVAVQNIGNQALDAVSPGLVVTGPNFAQVAGTGTPADCTSTFALAAGASCNLSISFKPQSSGPLSSTAVFTDNALNASPSATQSIGLSGMGAGVPPAITSTNSATFTIGVAGSFTVTTTGTPTPHIMESGALPNGLMFDDNGDGTGTLKGTPLIPGGSFSISFTAQNGVGSPATQTFTITVLQPPSFTSANSATFTIGVAGSFTVTTAGDPTPSITEAGNLPTGLAFHDNGNGTGTLYGTPLVLVGGDFGISFRAQNGIGSPATQAFTIVLRQAPAFTSANSITFGYGEANSFTVTTAGFPAPSIAEAGGLPPGVTFVDNHNGTATLAGTPSAGGLFPLVLTATNAVTTATQNFTLDVSGLSISPASLNFGTSYLNGSTTLSVTLKNMTKATVTVSGLSVTPGTANAGAYTAVSHCSAALKPGGSCTVAVTFAAKALGLQTATLNITDNTMGSPQQVGLSGYVIDPVAQFNPTKLSFGSQAVNSSTTLPVVLTNAGQTSLNIGGIAITGANSGAFTESNNCPAALAGGASCTISVTFAPTVKGARSGTLVVTDNVSGGQSTVALSGTGH